METLRARDSGLAGQLEVLLEEHRAAKQEGFLQRGPALTPESVHLAGQH